jgi:anti-sigma factor RsiW
MSGLLHRARFWRDHRWARRRMSDYIDAELGSALRARMERHLGECKRCPRLLADLRQILDGLHHLAASGPEVGAVEIAAAVRARLSEPG